MNTTIQMLVLLLEKFKLDVKYESEIRAARAEGALARYLRSVLTEHSTGIPADKQNAAIAEILACYFSIFGQTMCSTDLEFVHSRRPESLRCDLASDLDWGTAKGIGEVINVFCLNIQDLLAEKPKQEEKVSIGWYCLASVIAGIIFGYLFAPV